MGISFALFVTLVLYVESAGAFRPISITEVESLKLGSTRSDALAAFGQPTKKLRTLSKKSPIEEMWSYHIMVPLDGSSYEVSRVSLVFDSETGKLASKSVSITDDEPERSIEKARARFKDAKFVFSKGPVCGHHGPSCQFYSDTSKGVVISESIGTQEVSSISWRNPETKKPASVSNECGPAIRAEEIQ